MAGANLGPDFDLAKRITHLEDQISRLNNRDVLQNASIGAGGLTVNSGGSIQILGGGSLSVSGSATFNGSLSVPEGSLNAGGALSAGTSISAGTSLTAGTSISAGTSINGQSLNLSGAISGATSIGASGTVSAGAFSTGGGMSAGAVSSSGSVSGTTGTFNSGVYSTDARNFVVVTNYAASWIDVNGHFGISPSTERFKKDIIPWVEANPEAVFGIVPMKYRLRIPDRWMPIVDEQGDPVIDPDTNKQEMRLIEGFEDLPNAKERIGFIAERLVEAGFEEAVVFDEAGRPVSINYAEWVVPLQMGMRWLHTEWAKQKGQIENLTLRLDAAGL